MAIEYGNGGVYELEGRIGGNRPGHDVAARAKVAVEAGAASLDGRCGSQRDYASSPKSMTPQHSSAAECSAAIRSASLTISAIRASVTR